MENICGQDRTVNYMSIPAAAFTHPEDRMQKIVFDLTSEFVEVNQLLKLVGLVDSGGAGKNLVASGVVSVDGKQELRKTAKIRTGQVVTIGDVQIRVQ